MSVYKNRKSWYVSIWWRHQRIRKKSPLNTCEGAKLYEATLRKRLCAGEPLDGPEPIASVTFAEFAAEWFETYVKTNNRPSEQRQKESTLRLHLLPHFGSLRLDAIGTEDVERFKQRQRQRGLSAKSINNELTMLHKCLVCASEWGRRSAPLPKTQFLRAATPDPQRLMPEAMNRLLADDGELVWNAMIRLALRTGLRIGELLAVQRDDIDVEHGVLTVRHSLVRGILASPKNSRIRHVPLTAETLTIIQSCIGESPWIFHQKNGEPFTYAIAHRALDRACRRAGIPHTSWHPLRHTFASTLVDNVVPFRHIQELLGHATIAMTERYAHLAPGSLRAAVQSLEIPSPVGVPTSPGQPVVTAARSRTFDAPTARPLLG